MHTANSMFLLSSLKKVEECSFGSDYKDDYDPELVGDIEIGDDLKQKSNIMP